MSSECYVSIELIDSIGSFIKGYLVKNFIINKKRFDVMDVITTSFFI